MAKTVKVIKRKNSKIRRKRTLELAPESFKRNDDGTAVITVTLATDTPVLRNDPIFVDGKYYDSYYEVLTMAGLNSERIKGKRGIPFLNAHQTDDADKILGRSVPNSLKVGDKEATLDFRLGKRCATLGYTDDIANGTIGDTSVGYCINAFRFEIPDDGAIPTLYGDDYTIYENSAVPVPADPNAVIRGERDDDEDDEGDADAGDDERDMDDPDAAARASSNSDDDDNEDDQEDDDLDDDDDDDDETKREKEAARSALAKVRARKEARRNGAGFRVLDPIKDSAVRQVMEHARECGVFKKVDGIRKCGATLEQLRKAVLRSYCEFGEEQRSNRITSRPDAGRARKAEDGPEDVAAPKDSAPSYGSILEEVRRNKQT